MIINYGYRLALLRQQHKFTMAYVAKYIHKSRGAYEHYEAGRAEPSIDSLFLLKDLYGFDTIDAMLSEDQAPLPSVLLVRAYHAATEERRRIVDLILALPTP